MESLFALFLLLPLPMILNRWRGTGIIFWKITGVQIYVIYLGSLIFIGAYSLDYRLPYIIIEYLNIVNISLFDYQHSIIVSIFAIFLFLIGESFSWGKWVGSLCHPENITNEVKNNKCGKSFPYIHYMANYILSQDKNYKLYCQIALTIRGFIWWTPIMLLLGYLDLFSWIVVIINSFILAVGFPIACETGRNINFECNYKYFHTSKGWCNQEVVYGLIQYICLNLSIFLTLCFKG